MGNYDSRDVRKLSDEILDEVYTKYRKIFDGIDTLFCPHCGKNRRFRITYRKMQCLDCGKFRIPLDEKSQKIINRRKEVARKPFYSDI